MIILIFYTKPDFLLVPDSRSHSFDVRDRGPWFFSFDAVAGSPAAAASAAAAANLDTFLSGRGKLRAHANLTDGKFWTRQPT